MKSMPREFNSKDNKIKIQLDAIMKYLTGGVMLFEVGEINKKLYVSPSYFSMVGDLQSKDSSVPEDIFLNIYEEDRALVENTIRASVEAGEPVDCVYRAYFEGGRLGWRQLRGARIPYEGSDNPVFIAVLTDVTKLKEQEAKAILNDQRMRAVLECVSSVFWEFNLQSNSLSLSSVTEQGAREIKIINSTFPAPKHALNLEKSI